jgi:hypothetical protein
MKLSITLPFLITTALATQKTLGSPEPRDLLPNPYNPHQAQQQPLMSLTSSDKPPGSPLLGDIISMDKQIAVFSSLARSVASISELLSNRTTNTTVLAPSNRAIQSLPRPPWQEPEDTMLEDAVVNEKYRELEGDDRLRRNERRFVGAHCVRWGEAGPWQEGERRKTVEGVEVWWEERGGDRFIMPGEIRVGQRKDPVENGELWIVEGVVNYDR